MLHWNLHGLNEKGILKEKVLKEKGLEGKVQLYKMERGSKKMIWHDLKAFSGEWNTQQPSGQAGGMSLTNPTLSRGKPNG
jgi:hypothetical protein